MKRLMVSLLVALSAVGLLSIAGCAQSAPAAPTAAPAKAAAPVGAPTAAPTAKDAWPEKGKTITMLVGYAAGNPNDLTIRAIAPELEKALGVPVTVLNKTGANQQIAATELAKAKPDGYTLQIISMGSFARTYLDPDAKAPYSRKDFAYIAVVEDHDSALIVKNDSPFKNLRDVVDACKASPGKIVFTSTGSMSSGAVTAYSIAKAAGGGCRFALFDAQGATEAVTAVLGGNAHLTQTNTNTAVPQIKAGAARAIASTGEKRNQFVPDAPTIIEQGYQVESSSQLGLIAPAATPKVIIDKLQSTLKTVMTNPEVVKKMEDMFTGPTYGDTAVFSKMMDKREKDYDLTLEAAKAQQ